MLDWRLNGQGIVVFPPRRMHDEERNDASYLHFPGGGAIASAALRQLLGQNSWSDPTPGPRTILLDQGCCSYRRPL